MIPAIQSEDVLILLKLAVMKSNKWDLEFLSEELGHEQSEIRNSLDRLAKIRLINHPTNEIMIPELREFILHSVQYLFPAQPGKLVRGMLTGGKPGLFFAIGLPFTSIWAWPKEDGLEHGFEIEPLSPHCCFAATNDAKLRLLLGVTETMRVAGSEARHWAREELNRII